MISILTLFFIGLTLSSLLVTLIFILGIVWRVEAELDTAYKWFTISVILLLIVSLLDLLPAIHSAAWGALLLKGLYSGVATTLFLGMYFMRDLIRRMDGEKKA